MPQQLVAVQVAGGETFNVDEVAFSSTIHRTLRRVGGGFLLKVGGFPLKLYSVVSSVYPDVS